MSSRTALVTGATRGLGFETGRRLGRLSYRVVASGQGGTKWNERPGAPLRPEVTLPFEPWSKGRLALPGTLT